MSEIAFWMSSVCFVSTKSERWLLGSASTSADHCWGAGVCIRSMGKLPFVAAQG